MRVLAAVAAAALVATGSAHAATPPIKITRVQVTGKEFWYALSRHTVVAGPAIVEFVNYGEDPHDMRVQRAGGGRLFKAPVLQSGQYYDLALTLVPGRYRLWCSIANHRQLGMQAMLVVT